RGGREARDVHGVGGDDRRHRQAGVGRAQRVALGAGEVDDDAVGPPAVARGVARGGEQVQGVAGHAPRVPAARPHGDAQDPVVDVHVAREDVVVGDRHERATVRAVPCARYPAAREHGADGREPHDARVAHEPPAHARAGLGQPRPARVREREALGGHARARERLLEVVRDAAHPAPGRDLGGDLQDPQVRHRSAISRTDRSSSRGSSRPVSSRAACRDSAYASAPRHTPTMTNGTVTWTETQNRSNWPWTNRIMSIENASVPNRGLIRHSTAIPPRNRTRNPASPTIPAEESTSSSTLGGWKTNSVTPAVHHRSPIPTHGLRCHTSIESAYQVRRWFAELNWLPDASCSWTASTTK